jgi:hypothetical protein
MEPLLQHVGSQTQPLRHGPLLPLGSEGLVDTVAICLHCLSQSHLVSPDWHTKLRQRNASLLLLLPACSEPLCNWYRAGGWGRQRSLPSCQKRAVESRVRGRVRGSSPRAHSRHAVSAQYACACAACRLPMHNYQIKFAGRPGGLVLSVERSLKSAIPKVCQGRHDLPLPAYS